MLTNLTIFEIMAHNLSIKGAAIVSSNAIARSDSMAYGYFDDARREYVITTPKTPVKWVNYVGTLGFGGIVDHTGGSLLCKGDPATNRIVKYIPQLPSSDFKGETLYIREPMGNGYRVFSPFFVPTLDPYDHYECRVGLSVQTIISEFYGIRTEVVIFVPLDSTVCIRKITITNVGSTPRSLDVIPVVEYTHPDALKQFTNADWVPQTMTVSAISEADGHVILTEYPFFMRDIAINYHTSNQPVSSFETDRKLFLGDNEYGSWKNPLSLQQKDLSNFEASRGDIITALLHNCPILEPGQSYQLITQLGQANSISAARESIEKYRDPAAVDAALCEISGFWDAYLSHFRVETPDPGFNSMVNIHNPKQCYTTLNWSRYMSLYQLGLGTARGIGFRDSSQDSMGVMMSVPESAKSLLKNILFVQKSDGSAMHQFNPVTLEANEGDSREEDGHKYYGDDHLWIVLAVCNYLKETGNLSFLDEVIPFYDKNRSVDVREKGTVLDHLQRALAFTKSNIGRHGLPLLGFADWNDTVNLPGMAESVFIACQYGRALLEMIELMRYLGRESDARNYNNDHAAMKSIFNATCWDGEWYVRYFEESGAPIGSHQNEMGQIYVNAQSWSILGGFATPERAETCLESVNRKLNTRFGIKLSTPGYDHFDPKYGGISTYPPGAKENGGIFLHANPWVMIAETMLGHGDRAFQYYQQINPATRNDDIHRFECEPYVYPQNILGDEHPQFGLGRNSWLSGTSSWTYQAATQYICGIRPTYDGLLVDPCIPAMWSSMRIVRKFRNSTYDITIDNSAGKMKGVSSIRMDEKPITGSILPATSDGMTHIVHVVMG